MSTSDDDASGNRPPGPPQGPPPQGPPRPPQGPAWATSSAEPPASRPRHKKLWIGAAAGAVIVAASVAVFAIQTSGPDIQTKQGDVANADKFLDSVRDRWQSELPNENITVGEETDCYYVLDDKSEMATGQIACGAARRILHDEVQVWDIFSYATRTNGNGEVMARDATRYGTGLERPDGMLVNADGGEPPDDVEDIAAPEIPAADEPIVESGEDVRIEMLELQDVKKPEKKNTVTTPGGTLTVHSVATTPYVFNPSPHQAAEGGMIRVVTYTFQPHEFDDGKVGADHHFDGDPEPDDVPTTVSVDVDEQQHELATVNASGATGEKVTAVVSIPATGAAELVVASDGHAQRVDLESGQRLQDRLTETYYRDVIRQDVAKTMQSDSRDVTIDGESKSSSYSLEVKSAEISPYSFHRGLGYAPDGRMWLFVTYSEEFDSDLIAMNRSATWSARVGDTTSKASAVYGTDYAFQDEWVAVFDIPADATTVHVTSKNKFVVEGRLSDKKHVLTFDPITFKVPFPR